MSHRPSESMCCIPAGGGLNAPPIRLSGPSSRHLTSPLTVVRELRRCRLAWRSLPTRSHGGSQGFKSPHLYPQPCRSERRQRRAGDAHCSLRPHCGRKLKTRPAGKVLRDQAARPQASHNDHAAWSPPADYRRAVLARIQPLPVSHAVDLATAQPPPTTTKSKPALRWPSTAYASFECQAASSGRRRAVVDTAGDHADPGHPSRATACPTATLHDLIPVGHSGRRNPRTPDAHTGRRRPDTGHLDAQTSARTPDTDHLDRHPWDTGRSHRTPTEDAGRERGHGDDSTAGIRTSLATTPSNRTLGRPTVFQLAHYQPLLSHSAGQAAPRRTAVLR
jgi:hypothetical protein